MGLPEYRIAAGNGLDSLYRNNGIYEYRRAQASHCNHGVNKASFSFLCEITMAFYHETGETETETIE